MSRPKIVYWHDQPTPYMSERWNAVIERGSIDLVAWFNVERHADRSWEHNVESWKFPYRFVGSTQVFGKSLHLPWREFELDHPSLVIQEYVHPSMALGFPILRWRSERVAFRALPTYDAWVPRSPFRKVVKGAMFRAVDAVKTSGPEGVEMAMRFGVPRDRVAEVTQSVDVAHYGQAISFRGDRAGARVARGLHGCVFLYVGRIWKKKGLDAVFSAYERVIRQGLDVSLLLVGNGVDEEEYRARAQSLPNVVFTGFVQKSELPRIYALADVFVFPTLGDPHGLVVEEAMAAGLPVISSSSAGHISLRLPELVAGYIVPPDDAEVLADRMRILAASPGQRQAMGAAAIEVAARANHQRYAETFETFVLDTLRRPARRTVSAQLYRVSGRILTSCLAFRQRKSGRGSGTTRIELH